MEKSVEVEPSKVVVIKVVVIKAVDRSKVMEEDVS